LTYASSTPGNYTSYSYDGLNRRTLKTIHIGATGIVRHYYHSDQWQVLEERMSTSTNANIQYVWGQRYVDDMVLRERDTTGSGTLDERLYAMQDANWNVVAICDTSAAVQERYVYAGYGMQSFLTASYAPSTSSYIWIYLFTGREWEAEIGLLYCRNRHYHPLLGAWTQKDPIGYDGGDVNLYRYVLNNPGNLTDASGLENINKSITVPIYDIDRSHTDSKWQIATLTLTLSIGDSISRCKSNCGGTCTGSMGARLFFDWKPTPGANQSHAPEDNGTFWITDGIKRENIRTNPKTNRPFARYDFGRQPCAGFTIKKRLEVSGTLKDHPNITWPYYVIQVEATVEPCGNVTRESITIDISDYLFDKGNKSPND